MAYLLSNICAERYWNRTTIVEIIVGGWVVSCFETQCIYLRYIVHFAIDLSARKKLLHICEKELNLHWLGMAIDFKKSCRLCICHRCDTHYMNLQSMKGSMLQWVDKN